MRLSFLLASTLAYPSLELTRRAMGDFIAPPAGADRAPCPGLNTLANHGYLSRNGRNISDESIKDAFRIAYGLDGGISDTLIGTIKDLKNAEGTLDLNRLREHNNIVHVDSYFGPNFIVNQPLLDAFIAAAGGDMTASTIAAWRNKRQSDSKKNNPTYSLSFKASAAAVLEASTLLAVFGTNGLVPSTFVRTWLGSERLPEGFVPRSESNGGLITLSNVLGYAAQIRWHMGLF